jgi:hypothetical protein
VLSLGDNHAGRDTSNELEDLAADVPEESVGGPAADEHDAKNGYSCKVHGHGAALTDGVGPHIQQVQETQDARANAFDRSLELGGQESGGDKPAFVVG